MANMKAIGQLTAKTTPASTDVFALEDTEDTKKINYDALADAILNKITSKNYTVAGSSQTLINAINTLNSNKLSFQIGDYTSIASGADLNSTTYTTPGRFRSGGSSITDTLSHCPVSGIGFVMDVYPFMTAQFIVQEITTSSGIGTSNYPIKYFRMVNTRDNYIGEWKKDPTRVEIETLNSRFTTTIKTGDNLNDYTTSGLYIINAAAGNVENCPAGYSALIVTKVPNVSTVHQLCYNNNFIYTRAYTGNPLAWSAWKQVPSRDEFDTLNSRTGLKTLTSLGITTPCKVRDIVNALPYGCDCVVSITNGEVTDCPATGEMYIRKASHSGVIHKTDLVFRLNTASTSTLLGNYMIGMLPASGDVLWYKPTLTQHTWS